MPTTNFIDNQTVIYAAWCNDVDDAVYYLLGNSGTPAASKSEARTNLGLGSCAVQNTNSVALTGGTINGIAIGATTPSSGSFTTLTVNGVISQTSTSTFNQQVPNVTRTVSGGGAAVREIGDIGGVGTGGGIEFGISFNANLDIGTGVWANRDIANKNCWLEKWEGSASKKEIWWSGNTAVLDPPTWVLKWQFDCINDLMTVNVRTLLTSLATSVASPTTNYSVLATDHTVLADASSGELTVTLPSAVLNPNRIIVVKRINATNNVIVDSVAGSIDGDVSRTLASQWLTERYQSNGANWFVI